MKRILQREYGFASHGGLYETYQPPSAFTSVALSPEISSFFTEQMTSPSRVQGGLLFGYSEKEVLHLVVASSAGVANWYDPDVRAVLNIDTRFAFGWNEALTSIFGNRISWVGNWIAHPDGLLKSEKRDIRRFRDVFHSGLVDERHVLLVLGWADQDLRFTTYNKRRNTEPTSLDSMEFSRRLKDSALQFLATDPENL